MLTETVLLSRNNVFASDSTSSVLVSRIYIRMTSTRSSMAYLRLLALAACIIGTLAGPRYIAIPIDGVDVIELNPISPLVSSSSRLPRQTSAAETYLPVTLHHEYEQQQQPSRNERSAHTAHILDYVDFGAHTGPNGAFSWYADYPSHH